MSYQYYSPVIYRVPYVLVAVYPGGGYCYPGIAIVNTGPVLVNTGPNMYTSVRNRPYYHHSQSTRAYHANSTYNKVNTINHDKYDKLVDSVEDSTDEDSIKEDSTTPLQQIEEIPPEKSQIVESVPAEKTTSIELPIDEPQANEHNIVRNIVCERGHSYKLSPGSSYHDCDICYVWKQLNPVETLYDFVQTSYEENEKSFEFKCQHGHIFACGGWSANEGCKSCMLLKICKQYNMDIQLDTKCTYRAETTRLRFHCRKCEIDFYATPRDLKLSSDPIHNCADGHRKKYADRMNNMTVIFEAIFNDRFDDYCPIDFVGYNKKIGVAFTFRSESTQVLTKWCKSNDVLLILGKGKITSIIKSIIEITYNLRQLYSRTVLPDVPYFRKSDNINEILSKVTVELKHRELTGQVLSHRCQF